MKRIFAVLLLLLIYSTVWTQSVQVKLAEAFQQFENDPQLKNALASLYVVDARTGKVIFDKNATIGLAPASTQKIITSVTAYELLGKDFRYKTEFGIVEDAAEKLSQRLYIKPSGDPTLGSWRWEHTKEKNVIDRIVKAAGKQGIKSVSGIVVEGMGWNGENIPDGWIWQDIGNYYGAGACALNWRENQFNLILKSGHNIGDKVEVVRTEPRLYGYPLSSVATAAAKGSGDNTYVYFSLHNGSGLVRGTIPVQEDRFVIAGAMPNAWMQLANTLADSLKKRIRFSEAVNMAISNDSVKGKKVVFHTEYSPSLDSIIYWFNRKSINLYGEALIKTIAYQKKGLASTDKGIDVVKNFWKEKGIATTELNIVDGSGLSPLNRVTTQAQVKILQYAKLQPWFSGFYTALPEFNQMKMKSGTIQDVKGFTGYHTAKDGMEYIFSFLVNNYNGSSAMLVQKMYKVLDVLK